MKQLLLLRHAKSSWADVGLSDFERPLNARGREAAEVMADFLSRELPKPDVILCSSAQRTRETLAPLLGYYAHACDIHVLRELYHASEKTILDHVRRLGKGDTVLLIAHNPGMEESACELCGSGDMGGLYTKFPTAACAHIVFDVEGWSDVAPHKGHLQRFVTPRDLA